MAWSQIFEKSFGCGMYSWSNVNCTQCNVRRKCCPLALKLRVCLVWFWEVIRYTDVEFYSTDPVHKCPVLSHTCNYLCKNSCLWGCPFSVSKLFVCFDTLLLDLFSQELNSLEPHENFRLWLTAESHPKFPTILLQSSLKVTYEVSLIFFQLKKK